MQRGKTQHKSINRFENTLKKNGERQKPSRSKNPRQHKNTATPKLIKDKESEKISECEGSEYFQSVLKILCAAAEGKQKQILAKIRNLFEKEVNLRKVIRSKKENYPKDQEELMEMYSFVRKQQRESLDDLKIFMGQKKLEKLNEQDTREDLLRLYSLITSQTIKQANLKKSQGIDLVYEMSSKFDQQRRSIRLMSAGIQKLFFQLNAYQSQNNCESPVSEAKEKSLYSSGVDERSIRRMLTKISEKINDKKTDQSPSPFNSQKIDKSISVSQVVASRPKNSIEIPLQTNSPQELMQKILELEKQNLRLFKGMKQLQQEFEYIVEQKLVLQSRLQDTQIKASLKSSKGESCSIFASRNQQALENDKSMKKDLQFVKQQVQMLGQNNEGLKNSVYGEVRKARMQFQSVVQQFLNYMKSGGDYEEIIEKLEGVLTEKELQINKYLKKIGQDKRTIEMLEQENVNEAGRFGHQAGIYEEQIKQLKDQIKLNQVCSTKMSETGIQTEEQCSKLQDCELIRCVDVQFQIQVNSKENYCQTVQNFVEKQDKDAQTEIIQKFFDQNTLKLSQRQRQIEQLIEANGRIEKKFVSVCVENQKLKVQIYEFDKRQQQREKNNQIESSIKHESLQKIFSMEEEFNRNKQHIGQLERLVESLGKKIDQLTHNIGIYAEKLEVCERNLRESKRQGQQNQEKWKKLNNQRIQQCGMLLERKSCQIEKVWQKVEQYRMKIQDIQSKYLRNRQRQSKQIEKEELISQVWEEKYRKDHREKLNQKIKEVKERVKQYMETEVKDLSILRHQMFLWKQKQSSLTTQFFGKWAQYMERNHFQKENKQQQKLLHTSPIISITVYRQRNEQKTLDYSTNTTCGVLRYFSKQVDIIIDNEQKEKQNESKIKKLQISCQMSHKFGQSAKREQTILEQAEYSEKMANEFDISCKSSFLGEYALKTSRTGEENQMVKKTEASRASNECQNDEGGLNTGLPWSQTSYIDLIDESGFVEEITSLRQELDSCIQINKKLQEEIRLYQEKQMEKIFDF